MINENFYQVDWSSYQENLKKQIKSVAEEISNLDIWATGAASAIGKKILQVAERRRESVRSDYSRIKADTPSASVALANLQGREDELTKIIMSLSQTYEYQKRLAKELSELQDLAKEDLQSRETAARTTFVPDIVNEKQKQRGQK